MFDLKNKTLSAMFVPKSSAPKSFKKSIKEDGDGILKLDGFHILNAPHAINPVSVSDFSIIGKTSIRFESNDGECGQEPKWIDPTHPRWRTTSTRRSE